jgi:hypothetical protein
MTPCGRFAVTVPEPETVSTLIKSAIETFDAKRPRSIQSREGILGPSDLGFCRQKALLTLRGVPYSDSKSMWPAVIGTAVGEWVEAAVKDTFPQWYVGSIDNIRVTYDMANGASISGTPDIVATDFNAILDLKTKDGFEWEKRSGTSQNYRYQRHAYARGAIAAGLLDGSKPVYVGNVYLDRSGKDPIPYVTIEILDETLDDEIASWVDDVIYAHVNNEDANRDIAAPVCEKICEHFTACRGALPVSDDMSVFSDGHILQAIDMYVESRDMAKKYEAQRRAAAKELLGLNGIGGGFQVRTTHVNASTVAESYRQGYDKVDVVEVRGRKGTE